MLNLSLILLLGILTQYTICFTEESKEETCYNSDTASSTCEENTAIQIISHEDTLDSLKLNEEFLEQISSFPTITGLAGMGTPRIGKSRTFGLLIQELTGIKDAFKVARQMEACTQGVWAYVDEKNGSIIYDGEGYGLGHDKLTKLMAIFQVLSSSTFVMFEYMKPDNQLLRNIYDLTQLHEFVVDMKQEDYPRMIIWIRNPQTYDEEESKKYVKNFLCQDQNDDLNEFRTQIRKVFCNNMDVILAPEIWNLDKMDQEEYSKTPLYSKITELKTKFSKDQPLYFRNRISHDGKTYAQYLKNIFEALKNGNLNIETIYDTIQRQLCHKNFDQHIQILREDSQEKIETIDAKKILENIQKTLKDLESKCKNQGTLHLLENSINLIKSNFINQFAWKTWSSWSICDAECGQGHQKRTRECNVNVDYCLKYIDGEKEESKECSAICHCEAQNFWPQTRVGDTNYLNCDKGFYSSINPARSRVCGEGGIWKNEVNNCIRVHWNPWGAWGSCSTSCGGGIKTRYRECATKNNDDCSGLPKEETQCNNNVCPEWSLWSNWSGCSSCCGSGHSERQRTCNLPNQCAGISEQKQRCSSGACCDSGGCFEKFTKVNVKLENKIHILKYVCDVKAGELVESFPNQYTRAIHVSKPVDTLAYYFEFSDNSTLGMSSTHYIYSSGGSYIKAQDAWVGLETYDGLFIKNIKAKKNISVCNIFTASTFIRVNEQTGTCLTEGTYYYKYLLNYVVNPFLPFIPVNSWQMIATFIYESVKQIPLI